MFLCHLSSVVRSAMLVVANQYGRPRRVLSSSPCPGDLKAFGTATGSVLLTDYHGNETRKMRPHTKAVTDLSMDITGDFVARRALFLEAGKGKGGGEGRGRFLAFYGDDDR